MPDDRLSPKVIAENIRRATERRNNALAEYEAARAELAWWVEGQKLFGGGKAPPADQPDWDASVTELFPPASAFTDGTEPTLRQAIVIIMRESEAAHWRVSDLASALAHRGWLPKRDDPQAAQKRVSDLAGVMVEDGQLYRMARGVYSLTPQFAAALDSPNINRYILFGTAPAGGTGDKE